MLGPLSNREFRRLFAGRLVTNAGDSLYYIASMWLVFELTGSELYTGVAGFLIMAPSALQFAFGPLVDRFPLRRVLVGTQLVQGLIVLVVPVAAAMGMLSVWLLLVLMPLLSLINQPVYPAESAALPRLLDQEELVAANSLFSVAYQGADAVFNGLAGLLVASIGAVSLFVVDSLTFGVAVVLFATLDVPAAGGEDPGAVEIVEDDGTEGQDRPEAVADGGESPTSYVGEIRDGVGFIRGTIVSKLLVGAVVVNFAFGGVMAVLPSFAASVDGAGAYGVLTAAVSGGLLAGAVAGNGVKRFPFGRVLVVGLSLGGVLWGIALLVDSFAATVLLLGVALIPAGITNVTVSAIVQTLVPEGLLGRVSAVLGSASVAMTPVGALVGGAVAEATSALVVMWGAGLAMALLALYVFVVPQLRRLPRVDDLSTLSVD